MTVTGRRHELWWPQRPEGEGLRAHPNVYISLEKAFPVDLAALAAGRRHDSYGKATRALVATAAREGGAHGPSQFLHILGKSLSGGLSHLSWSP